MTTSQELPLQEKIVLHLKHDLTCAVEQTGVCNCQFYDVANQLIDLYLKELQNAKEEGARDERMRILHILEEWIEKYRLLSNKVGLENRKKKLMDVDQLGLKYSEWFLGFTKFMVEVFYRTKDGKQAYPEALEPTEEVA